MQSPCWASKAGQCWTNRRSAVPDWPWCRNADSGLTQLTADKNADDGLTFCRYSGILAFTYTIAAEIF